jgi:hypothetical protein
LAHAAAAAVGSGAAVVAVSTQKPLPAPVVLAVFALGALGLLRVRVYESGTRRQPRPVPALGAVVVLEPKSEQRSTNLRLTMPSDHSVHGLVIPSADLNRSSPALSKEPEVRT